MTDTQAIERIARFISALNAEFRAASAGMSAEQIEITLGALPGAWSSLAETHLGEARMREVVADLADYYRTKPLTRKGVH